MDDEAVWLQQADYDADGDEISEHRLRKAPIAAAIAAAATLAMVMAMPRAWIARVVYELYIDRLIPAAKLPLDDMAQAAFAFVLAAIVAAAAFLIARYVDFGKLVRAKPRPAAFGEDYDDEDVRPMLRRADVHPDAPSRAPFRFGDADVDEVEAEPIAIDGDYEDVTRDEGPLPSDDEGVVYDGGAAEAALVDELGAEDEDAFDLGGFEAVVVEVPVVDSADSINAAAVAGVFDVGAIDDLDSEPDEAAWTTETVALTRPAAGAGTGDRDAFGDVRKRFAGLFGEGVGEDRGDVRADLTGFSTGHLIDELERRLAERRADAPETVMSGALPKVEAEAEAVVPEARANEDLDADFEDMDAALKAALGTLARMQGRSAG